MPSCRWPRAHSFPSTGHFRSDLEDRGIDNLDLDASSHFSRLPCSISGRAYHSPLVGAPASILQDRLHARAYLSKYGFEFLANALATCKI